MRKIKFCSENKINLIKIFLKKNWPTKINIFNNRNLINWMYYDSKLKKYLFLISEKNNKIKSCLGILKNNFTQKKIFWLSFWLSSSDRKSLSGLDLLYFLMKKKKNHVVAANGINVKTTFIYKRLGFNTINLNHYYLVNLNKKKFHLIKIKNQKKIMSRKNSLNIEISDNLIFLKNNKYLQKFEKDFYKNYYYFKKKYYDHPIYNYKFYKITCRNKIYGFFVGRVCIHNGNTALRFVEYFGSLNILGKIKYNLLELIKNSEHEYIDFYNFGIKRNLVKKTGFSINKFKSDVIIPNYFEPFVKANITICSVFWPRKTKMIIFKGDGDQDRPNLI